jgi:hypothetical protein
MPRAAKLAPILFLILSALAGAQSTATLDTPPYPGFDVKYGIPAGTELKSLIERPSLIAMKAEKFRDPESGEWRLRGFGEAQGVYNIGFDQVRAILDDPTAARGYSPRLLDARIEAREGGRLVAYQEIGISFLGFKVSYRFREEQIRDDLGPGELGYRIRLLQSLDGTFFEAYSSWYVKEVIVDGRRLVYMRHYTRPGIRRPAPGLELIVRGFTPGELKTGLDGVAKEARRRADLR